MYIKKLHNWNLDLKQAKRLQTKLAGKVLHKKTIKFPKIIAATDCGLDLKKNEIYGVVVLFEYPSLKTMETKTARLPLKFPYIPGFLSFRECPVLIKTFEKLKNTPDLVFVDGHGVSHPRSVGIASHLGLWLNIPTIGCAKSLLCGEYKNIPGKKGNHSYIKYKGKTTGIALVTRDNCKPIFISVGHKINLETALEFTSKCADGYRIPKPTRIADKITKSKNYL